MSAGEPNWVKLYEMGKLPENQRHRIPFLVEIDKKEKEISDLKNKQEETQIIDLNCKVEGCAFVAKSAHGLKIHQAIHNKTN